MVAQTMVRQLVSKVQHIDLIGALPHIAKKTLKGISGLNVPMHALASRHKTSTGALHPPLDCALLPR
jgi:hypothetical protein